MARIGRTYPGPEYIKHLDDSVVFLEMAARTGTSFSKLITPVSPSGMTINLQRWKNAVLAAQNAQYPNMNLLYEVFDNIMIDNSLTSNIDTRILKAQQSKFNVVDAAGKPNPDAKKLLEAQWFFDFIKIAMQSQFEGFRLIELFDFEDDGTLKTVTAVNKYHVKPHKGIVTKNPYDQEGTSYLEGATSLYYIPVGSANDLGLLYKVAPHILAKKYALGNWSEFNEKMGIPFRTVTTNMANTKRQEQLGVIMDKMGSAGWAVLNEGEKVELLEAFGSDPTKCFEGLINVLDSERAMLILGQSSTSNSNNNKGTYGSMKILQDISNDRHEADLTFLKYLINGTLLKRLPQYSSVYNVFKNLTFEWDKSIDLGIADLIDYSTNLKASGYVVDPAFITQKTGIPILSVESTPAPAPPAPIKKKSLTAKIAALYKPCCSYSPTSLSPKAGADEVGFQPDMLRIAKQLFDGKHNGVIDIELLKKTAAHLQQGISTGYGNVATQVDKEMVANLEKNVYVFSGFKTYQTLRAATDALKDADGNIRSWSDFKKEILQIDNTYNNTYLKAEYDHAVIGSQMASQWQDIQKNKDTLPYLKFVATEDNRTTQICKQLDDTLLPVDDSFWSEYMLPLHWHERSLIQQVDSGTVTTKTKVAELKQLVDSEIKPMFKNNIGKTGVLFPEVHPYFDTNTKVRKEIEQAVDKVYLNTNNTKVVYSKNGKDLVLNAQHNKSEVKNNTRLGKIIVDAGHDVLLPAHSFEHGVKNPDAIIDNNKIADFKGMQEPTMTAAFNAIKSAGKQKVSICILEPLKSLSQHDLKEAISRSLWNTNRNKSITDLWIIYKKEVVKITRAEIVDLSFIEKLK